MDLFCLSKPLLHALPAECAHDLAIKALAAGAIPKHGSVHDERLVIDVCGLHFLNPVGIAAGFDKNAQTLGHVFSHGIGFMECGTVTPKPQPGNPKPRLFRVKGQEAVINRFGFNNDGIEVFAKRLEAYHGPGIVGANIGKNKDSDDAVADYVTCMRRVYDYAHYITVNISSPNTKGLRDLQEKDSLEALIDALLLLRAELMAGGATYKPVFVKIAPDLDEGQKEDIARLALDKKLDALIVSNTTITRPGITEVPEQLQQGGMSGKPLMELSTKVLADLYRLTEGKIPLMGVGGIASGADAYAKIKAGASLVQLYSALVYQGLGLINCINRELLERLEADGLSHIRDAIGKEA